MTEYAETYLLSVNFPGGLNRYQLQQQIAATNIIRVCTGIITDNDTVYIIFNNVLTNAEKITLNTLIQNYVYVVDNVILKNVLAVTPNLTSVSINMYKRVASLVMPVTTAARAYIISYIDEAATSYDVIFINRDNAQIMLDVKNLTNTSESKIDLGYLTNIPNNQIQIDVSLKKNGGNSQNSAKITNITLYYS